MVGMPAHSRGVSDLGIYAYVATDCPPWANGHRRRTREILLALLRDLREEAGLRQEDAARALRRPQSYVSNYESGGQRLDVLGMWQVCRAIDVTFTQFARRLDPRLTRRA